MGPGLRRDDGGALTSACESFARQRNGDRFHCGRLGGAFWTWTCSH